jgi:signal transduction histidine kinase
MHAAANDMIALIILAVIVFALIQRRRYRDSLAGDRWTRKWERWQLRHEAKFAKWDYKWRRWERRAQDFVREAPQFERKLKQKLNAAGILHSQPDRATAQAQAAAKDESAAKAQNRRAMYERAHRRAAQEAGFYMHLLWYGIVIGFLLILNMLTTHYQWWIFPAIGWGIGLASHFVAVYGWRWIHDRVFDAVILREVQREVTLEKEAMRTQNQASLNELAATFAHEIRNPIAAAKSLVQQMGEDPVSNENVEYAKVALDELARVERSVSHLLKYAKEEDYTFDNVNLAAVLDQALTQMRGKLEAQHVSVSRSYIAGPTVRADADKLRQVFSNVIDNAIDAMETTIGERCLELAIESAAGQAVVVIRDNGCGIPADKLGKIFNPFYTTKRNGTGLGMGVARKVLEAHRGRIDVQSTVGVGTQCMMSIPLADAARAWRQSTATPAAAEGSAPSPDEPAPPLRARFGGVE